MFKNSVSKCVWSKLDSFFCECLLLWVAKECLLLWAAKGVLFCTGNGSYSDQQKHESSCLLSESLSCISPEPLELQKNYLHLFASSSEELSDEI